jgi:hypothetical protein
MEGMRLVCRLMRDHLLVRHPFPSLIIPIPISPLIPKANHHNNHAVMNLNWGWASSLDDATVYATIDRFVSRSVDLAKERGLDNRFIYINYASQEQDVFGGYGEVNEKRLREVRREYDPEVVFGRLWRGYFKLD